MAHLIIWFVVLTLLGIWTLGAWLTHSLLGWSGWEAAAGQDVNAVWTTLVGQLGGLAPWLGGEWLAPTQNLLLGLGAWLQPWLGLIPGLLQWLIPVVWIIWGLGALLLIVLGAGASLGWRWFKKRQSRSRSPQVLQGMT